MKKKYKLPKGFNKQILEEGFDTLFEKAWKELGGPDDTPIGEVSPGIYCIGKGVYTGIGGWQMFCKALDDKLKIDNDGLDRG